jgi:hypothetical protein
VEIVCESAYEAPADPNSILLAAHLQSMPQVSRQPIKKAKEKEEKKITPYANQPVSEVLEAGTGY